MTDFPYAKKQILLSNSLKLILIENKLREKQVIFKEDLE